MVLFQNIVYNLIPVSLPEYLSLFDGNTPLRSTYLDQLCYVSSIIHRTKGITNLNKSFFFRSHSLWNTLPYDKRATQNHTEFLTSIEKYFWNLTVNDTGESGQDGLSLSEEDEL